MDPLAIISPKGPESGSAQSQGLFQHRVEHRREVTGRGINDLQHFRGRGLLSEGLVALGSALGEFASKVTRNSAWR